MLVAAQSTWQLHLPLLWLSVAIPMVSGLLSILLNYRIRDKLHAMLAAVSWLLSLTLLTYPALIARDGRVVVDPFWAKMPGIGSFALFLDGASLPVALSVAVVSLIISVYSLPYMRHRFHELGGEQWGLYYLLYQLFTAGMLGAVLSSNGILFYLFLEVTLLPSALLIILYGYGERLRVGLIYLIWTHAGAILFLLGLFLAKSFDFYVPGQGYVVDASRSLLALVLVIIGLGIKSAFAGLHFWLPYAHAEAPTPISALLSPLLIGIGGYALVRVGPGLFHGVWHHASWPLFLWATLTMIYGGLLVLVQRDVKRLLAYSSVSQMGYMLFGLAVSNHEALTGSLLHYAAHAYGKAVLFGAAGALIVLLGTRSLDDMGGLARSLSYTAGASLLGFMLISGLPPTLGLWSELYLVFGYAKWAVGLGSMKFALSALLTITAMTLTVIYSFQTYRVMFLGAPRNTLREGIDELGEAKAITLSITLLAVIGVLLFILVAFLAEPASRVASRVYEVAG
ncbi:MAG: NADH-quinone oxidoreductase subunit M [Hyperthermus sp.]|nr:MAG: NADH-quinone oxidoreductase subunit M [Hyperthermus sp.]